MKKIIILFVVVHSANILIAQNVGIGTTEPMNKLQVQGNLLVTTPTTATGTAPTAGQIKTMVNAGTVNFLNSDSTGRIYDPGGAAGNYSGSQTANTNIAGSSNTGIEIIVETMALASGDSLIIKEFVSGATLEAVGNGYTATGRWVFNSSSLYIIFKSNADANVGVGFSLLFRRLYSNSGSLPDLSGYNGNAFFFDTKTGVLRSGKPNNSAMGNYSVALGNNNTATGTYSIALGSSNISLGPYSTSLGNSNNADGVASIATGQNTSAGGAYTTAMGQNTIASGNVATAFGYGTLASGSISTALGDNTSAIGSRSTAMGQNTSAEGSQSTAMGNNTSANGNYSTAMGYSSIANGVGSTAFGYSSAYGDFSTSMGSLSYASGHYSTAMGGGTTASGLLSTSMGSFTTASGDYSTAIGSFVNTNYKEGTLVIGDHSTTTTLNSNISNFFYARFAGGYGFYTSSDLTSVCILGPGANAWSTSSDMRLKENLETVNGEDFLKKIATMPLVSWNYKKQDPSKYRHYGPMAQDFYAAFGKDKYGTIGNDTTINSADFAGVSFIAIQALEKRTAVQQRHFEETTNALRKEIEASNAIIQNQQKQIDELKTLVNKLTTNMAIK